MLICCSKAFLSKDTHYDDDNHKSGRSKQRRSSPAHSYQKANFGRYAHRRISHDIMCLFALLLAHSIYRDVVAHRSVLWFVFRPQKNPNLKFSPKNTSHNTASLTKALPRGLEACFMPDFMTLPIV